jgi:hypothetical protein
MKPSIWGPHLWTSIHLIALGYPEEPSSLDKSNYKTFFTILGTVLPCSNCSQNYAKHFLELPIDSFLGNKKSLFTWTVQLHNIVNIQNDKPIWSIDDAYEYYREVTQGEISPLNKSLKNNCLEMNSHYILMIVLLLIINASMIIFIYRKTK